MEDKLALLKSLEEEDKRLDKLPNMPTAPNQPQPSNSFVEGLKGAGRTALSGIVKAGEAYDSYTGAPTRAAIGSLQEDMFDIPAAAKAFAYQFGQDPSTAPTGKDIMKKAGLSEKPMFNLPWIGGVSPAGMAGLALDVTADPTNVIPIGTIAKGVGKTVKAGAKPVSKLVAKTVPRYSAKAVDALTGTKATGKAVEGVIDTAESTADLIKQRLNPVRASNYEELKSIATKNGIAPELLPASSEFGKRSFISRGERKQAEGILGEPLLEKHEKVTEEVNRALNDQVRKLSSEVLTPVEAGSFIRKSYDDAVEKVFNEIDFTYKSAGQQVPRLNISKAYPKIYDKLLKDLKPIRTEANKMVKYGVTNAERTQGAEVLGALQRLEASNGNYNIMVDQLRAIGRAAFKAKNILADIPPDIQKLRKMYFKVQDALINTTGKIFGDKIAADLVNNNKFITDFLSDKSIVAKYIGSKELANEKLFEQLVKNGDTKKIEALFNVLGADKVKELKGAFVNSLIKENIEGKVGFRTLHNSLRDKKSIASLLLEPNELKDMQDLLKLGDSLGIPIMSTSGTGPAQSFMNIAKNVGPEVINQKILDRMKEIARNKSVPQKAITETATETTAKAIPNEAMFGLKAKRSPLTKGLKVGQVLSVQKQNEKKDKQRQYQELLKQYNSM